jgi:hypothetical protein
VTNGLTTVAAAAVAAERAPVPAANDPADRISCTSPAAILATDVVHTRLVVARSTWASVQLPWAEEPPPKEHDPTELRYKYGSASVTIVCVGMGCTVRNVTDSVPAAEDPDVISAGRLQ